MSILWPITKQLITPTETLEKTNPLQVSRIGSFLHSETPVQQPEKTDLQAA